MSRKCHQAACSIRSLASEVEALRDQVERIDEVHVRMLHEVANRYDGNDSTEWSIGANHVFTLFAKWASNEIHQCHVDVANIDKDAEPEPLGELQYDTRRYREKMGIDVNLPVNFKRVWMARMPLVTEMVQHGMTLDLIAEYYNCSPTNVSLALKVNGTPISRIKHDFRQAFAKKLKEQGE